MAPGVDSNIDLEVLGKLPVLRLRWLLDPSAQVGFDANQLRGAIGAAVLGSGDDEAQSLLFGGADSLPVRKWGAVSLWALSVSESRRQIDLTLAGPAVALDSRMPGLMQRALSERVGQSRNVAAATCLSQPEVGSGGWFPGSPGDPASLRFPCEVPAAARFRTRSLLRFKRAGVELRSIHFQPRDLVVALMRRISGLCVAAGLSDPIQDALALLAGVEDWQWLDPDWRDESLSRHSARQRQSMCLQGVTGAASLPPDMLERFWPLLWLGQFLHVGRGASMGCGSYRMLPK